MEFARAHIHEQAAVPKYLEIIDEMPLTNVGKIFKPDLRKSAITRIFDETLSAKGIAGNVTGVTDDKKLGLVATIKAEGTSQDEIADVLTGFVPKWELAA